MKDYITLFREWVGESRCPDEYLRWAAISLLAAACGNRVWTPRRIGAQTVRVYPNQYILFIGPSSNFKSFAMSRVREILKGVTYRDSLNLYSGHVTNAGMYEAMKSTHRVKRKDGTIDVLEYPYRKHFYLLNDELANDLGSGEFAELFIKSLTEMYFLEPFDDRTRTSGWIHLEDYSINWLACSTQDWLLKTLGDDMFMGGFFGRTVTVVQGYKRTSVWKSERPKNWGTLYEILTKRIDELLAKNGVIKRSKDAMRIEDAWVEQLTVSNENDPTVPAKLRQYDLSLKLSIILALAKWKDEIDDEDMVDAQELSEKAIRWQASLVPNIEKLGKASRDDRLLMHMKGRATIKRHQLAKVAYDKIGMRAAEVDQVVRTWVEANIMTVEEKARNLGGIVYRFKKNDN